MEKVGASSSGANDRGTRWQELTATVRYQMDMPADAQPWTGSHNLVGVSKTKRSFDLIQVAWWAWRKQNPASRIATPKWFCDVSQQVNRKPWGPAPDCCLQSPELYMFSLDRVADSGDSSTGNNRIH